MRRAAQPLRLLTSLEWSIMMSGDPVRRPWPPPNCVTRVARRKIVPLAELQDVRTQFRGKTIVSPWRLRLVHMGT